MRRADLYMAGLYAGIPHRTHSLGGQLRYIRKYQQRKKKIWEEIWKHTVGRCTTVLLLTAILGTTVKNVVDTRLFIPAAARLEMAEPAEVLDKGNASVLESYIADMDTKEEQGAVYSEYAAGNIIKAREDTLIVLDPGHGGADEGCARNGIQEKEINLQIAFAVQLKLQELGYQVRLTRNADMGLSLEERVNIANNARADAYVSIHQNASEVTGVEGIEVWYSAQNAGEESERLSKLIQKFAVQDTGAVDREILEEENLYVIRECPMPSCLVETGFLSNAGERGKLTSAEYQDQIADGIVSGIDLFFHPKTMYLTFDDGPSEENTAAVLDILKEKNIKATFFVIGENVRNHPEVARRIVEEGHTIGIHCDWHEYKTLYQSVDSYVADFEKAYETVKEVTGVEARLFRFPGGSINSYNKGVYKDIIEEMTNRGFIYFDWNASLEDAVKKADADTLIENAVSSTLNRNRVVMLAHDVVYQTGQCLDELIEQFPEYRMEPLTEDVTPIQF